MRHSGSASLARRFYSSAAFDARYRVAEFFEKQSVTGEYIIPNRGPEPPLKIGLSMPSRNPPVPRQDREQERQPEPDTARQDCRGRDFRAIDHIAIAVVDLEQGIDYFSRVLGFSLVRRLQVSGKRTGMLSAEMEMNGIKFVLCQGTERESQVSRLVEHCGPGVAHIALAVSDVDLTAHVLAEQGMHFDTTVIRGPGLTQVFSARDPNSGLSFEFIERSGEQGFLKGNVNELFAQLEQSGAY